MIWYFQFNKLHRLTERDSRLAHYFAQFWCLGLLLGYSATSGAKSDVRFLSATPISHKGDISLSFRDLTRDRQTDDRCGDWNRRLSHCKCAESLVITCGQVGAQFIKFLQVELNLSLGRASLLLDTCVCRMLLCPQLTHLHTNITYAKPSTSNGGLMGINSKKVTPKKWTNWQTAVVCDAHDSRLTASFCRTTLVSRHQKGRTILDLTEPRDHRVAVTLAGP